MAVNLNEPYFKKLDAILLGKQDQFPIDLTDDLLFENLCA